MLSLLGSQIWKIKQIAALQKLTIHLYRLKNILQSSCHWIIVVDKDLAWHLLYCLTSSKVLIHACFFSNRDTGCVIFNVCSLIQVQTEQMNVLLPSMISTAIPLGLTDLNWDCHSYTHHYRTWVPLSAFSLCKTSFSWNSFPLKNKVYLRLRSVCWCNNSITAIFFFPLTREKVHFGNKILSKVIQKNWSYRNLQEGLFLIPS